MSRIVTIIAFTIPMTLSVMAEESAPPAAKSASAAGDRTLNNIDLRLSLNGGNEGITKRRNESLGTEAAYDDDSSGGIAAHVLYLRARPGGVGFAVGGGLSAFTHEGKPELVSGQATTIETISIDIYAAFVYRPMRQWHFELPALVVSSGAASVETEGQAEKDEGSYGRFALQVGAYYTFDFGLQLGVDLGGAGFWASVDRDIAPNVTQEFIYTGSGGYINLNAGFRF
jgi:hypothetical protein